MIFMGVREIAEGETALLCTEDVPEMTPELRAMDGRIFDVKSFNGRYYTLKGCKSKTGIPFAILDSWIVPIGEKRWRK